MVTIPEHMEEALYDEEFELSTILGPHEGVINTEHLQGVLKDIGDKLDRITYYNEKVDWEYLKGLKTDLDFIMLGARP
jgi:hypothetical protein